MPARREQGTTTQRGYGHDHQVARKRLLPKFLNTPCPCECGCGVLMVKSSMMDFDHPIPLTVDPEARASRFLCRKCNRGHRSQEAKRVRSGAETPLVGVLGATTVGW